MKKLLLLFTLFLMPFAPSQANETDQKKVDTVLTRLHKAAAEADWPVYFSLYDDSAIFMGTDVSERWDKATFQKYASETEGWIYWLRERNIYISPDNNTAWFDEILDSKNYGTSRGTGALIRTNSGWKIAQYHLTFPLPNDLAGEIIPQIQAFEEKQKQGKK